MRKIFFSSFCTAFFLLAILCACSSQTVSAQEDQFILPQYSKKISLDFRNANIKDVLKAFAKQIGVSFITSREVEDRQVTVFLEDVPVEEALNKLLSVNNLAYEYDQLANMIMVKVKPKPQGEEVITKVYQLRYASVTSAKIKSTISVSSDLGGDSSDGGGGGAGTTGSGGGGIKEALESVLTADGKVVEDARTNSVIITDQVQVFPAVERMLARLDVPVPQVLIQVEMLDVDKSTMDKMGADFNVAITATGASKKINFPWDDDNAVNKYGGSQDISSGTIDASTASVLLEFIKNQGTTRSLARPRIVTVDNETAQVKISTDEAIGITQETSSTGSIGTSSTEAEREETGVILTVTPQVNILTDEITLAVEPKVKVAKQSTITIQGQNLKDPEERSVKAILRVRSGDTIFIGGLLRRADAETQSSLPILGDIPILGMAFRHKSKIVADRELVVFITPHILGPSADMPETIREDLLKIPEVRERNALKQKRTGLIDQEMDKAAEQK